MDVSVKIPLSDDDVERLRTSLGPNADLDRIVNGVVLAGATEFLSQATGRVVPAGIREARLYRVFERTAETSAIGGSQEAWRVHGLTSIHCLPL